MTSLEMWHIALGQGERVGAQCDGAKSAKIVGLEKHIVCGCGQVYSSRTGERIPRAALSAVPPTEGETE